MAQEQGQHWAEEIKFVEEQPKQRRRGRPLGTPGGGRYGCRTKVVRVPEAMADNIDKILLAFEEVRLLVDTWEGEIEQIDIKKNPRYDKARKLLEQLRVYLGD